METKDLTLGGRHTVQYTDLVTEMHTWNLCDPSNQCHPNKFKEKQKIITIARHGHVVLSVILLYPSSNRSVILLLSLLVQKRKFEAKSNLKNRKHTNSRTHSSSHFPAQIAD